MLITLGSLATWEDDFWGTRLVSSSNDTVGSRYLVDLVRTFRNYKALGDGALSQVSDADLHTLVDPGANSIAVIVQHLAGNLRSRFTDFLTSDGEKPDRDRDAEFEMPQRLSRDDLVGRWDEAWAIALASVGSLTAADLERTVTIRGEPFLVARGRQPPGRARRVSRRPDRAARQALRGPGVEVVEHPERAVEAGEGRVQAGNHSGKVNRSISR